MRDIRWRALLTIAVIVAAVWSGFPLQKKINLGLDLQGGMHIVISVDTSALPDKAK
ncbi:MAG: protein translocase subunit SecD, partial [bacterium (Candidatus Stahlbacteria) CG23_combo_of_CG06-09_8_20_14_all_34_7]